MIAAPWRERLTYLAMSAVVGWHSLALIIAPMPDASTTAQAARGLLQPYLSLFRLDNSWSFFAPEIGRQVQFRYIVESADGQRRTFVPQDEINWSFPRYVMWREFKYLQDAIAAEPEAYAERVTALLCRKHATLKPVAISILHVQEGDFWPDDYLQGRHPLDPDFIIVSTMTNMAC